MPSLAPSIVPDSYDRQTVERLLGLHESWRSDGDRDVTILDLLSWLHDPGGMVLVHETEDDAWMARRGMSPHDDWAVVLWDVLRAVDQLKRTQVLKTWQEAALTLAMCGWSRHEMARVLCNEHGRPVDYKQVHRFFVGRPKRNGEGREVRDHRGRAIYEGGVVGRLTRLMNREVG